MKVTKGGNCQCVFHFPIPEKDASSDLDLGIDDRGKTVVGRRVVKMISVTRNRGHSEQVLGSPFKGNGPSELQVSKLALKFP